MISAVPGTLSIPENRSMTPVNIRGQQLIWQLNNQCWCCSEAHAAVTCSGRRQLWQLEGGDLENSAGGPTSEKGRSFVVDLVLEDFAGCELPVALPPPPAHFHLKTHNTDVCCVKTTHTSSKVQTWRTPAPHTCPCMSLQKPVGRPCTRRARLHWWVRPLTRFSGPSSSPSSSSSPPSQRVSITTLPCRRMPSNFPDQTAESGSKSVGLKPRPPGAASRRWLGSNG